LSRQEKVNAIAAGCRTEKGINCAEILKSTTRIFLKSKEENCTPTSPDSNRDWSNEKEVSKKN